MAPRPIDHPTSAHADPDRELITAIRAELAAIEPTRACCRAAERAGLGAAASGRARSPVVARLAVRLEGSRRAGAAVPVDGGPAGSARHADGEAALGSPIFAWEDAADHCRVAYLRGVFLARGSLSLAAGRTHLEFVLSTGDGEVLAARLADFGLPAAERRRRGRDVVTWKSTEAVMTFLRRLGSSTGVLELESRLVTRSLRGHLNRVLNAEGANLSRSVASSTRQLAAIEQLEAAGELARLPRDTRAVASGRVEVPEATLTELAQRLGMSRARVQRAFEQLEAATLSDERSSRDRPRGHPPSHHDQGIGAAR